MFKWLDSFLHCGSSITLWKSFLNKDIDMASISQLVSEMSHTLGQPSNVSLREKLKLAIVHTRNEIIRRSYENHGYVDKGIVQRYKVSLIGVPDGDDLPQSIIDDEDIRAELSCIKRTKDKVHKPVRLTNNLPFDRVSTAGAITNREIPFIKETSARFRSSLPGMCAMPCYDFINGYIYIFPADNKAFMLNHIVIESAFEYPTLVGNKSTDNLMDSLEYADDDEWFIPEDMVGQLKEIIYKREVLVDNNNNK